MSEALYRKYRPQMFGDVVGQEHIERTLKNAIDGNRVSHAYLFTGPRGTGKTTTARLLAKALICENGPTSNPCGICEDCELIAAGIHPDVYELDAASRTGVDNVREEIIGRVQYAPTRGRSKIYIVDEVHMLSTAAFNALLKTLEEPPGHVVFILCTTDPQKVPETIRSRCQRFDFRRISPENIVSRLGAICVAEGVEFEGEALDLIAQRADGGMRDALTSLEQLITYGGGKVALAEAELLLGSLDVDEMAKIVEAIGNRDAAAGFRWVARYVETGADLAQFAQNLVERMRNLYVYAILGSDACVAVGEVERRQIVQELSLFGPDRLAYIMGVLGDLQKELKTSANQRLTFEIALARMARPHGDLTLEALAARLEALEAGAVRFAETPASVSAQMAAEYSDASQQQYAPAAATAQLAQPTQPTQPAWGAAEAAEPAEPAEAAAPAAFAEPVESTQPVSKMQADQPQAGGEAGAAPVQRASQPGGACSVDMANNAALQRAWQHVMAKIKKEKTAYGVLFLNTKARNDNGRLVIEFAAESDFAFKAVQKPDVDEVLSQAIRHVFAADVPYSITQAASPAAGAGASMPARSAAPAQGFVSAAAPAAAPISDRAPAAGPEQGFAPTTTSEPVASAEAAPIPSPAVQTQPVSQAPSMPEPPEYEAPPYDDWAPESEEEPFDPPFDSQAPVQDPAEDPTGGEAADSDMANLQDALSLFGAVKIEEID